MYYINDKEYKCSVAVTLDIFNDRWKLSIIWHLLDGKKRFKELNEIISEITQKTLTVKLKDKQLEINGESQKNALTCVCKSV